MKPSNPLLRRSTVTLEKAGRKQKAPIWTTASAMLSSPSRTRVEVNVGRISRIAKDGEAIFVPGKVLAGGVLEGKIIVGAFAFSMEARSKIEASGGKALSVDEFLKKYPDGSGVKLVR
ncbi:MAG TPA: 50S ribosomal protein L18e [Nitrososphaerales archaeon]|nr:50S ribosomal protein L18e [Nitrososphaerales archaeon]